MLDVGCGTGESFSQYFINNNWEVIGIDYSKRMIELASRSVPEMKTIHIDMRKAEFLPNQFDAITAIYSLFHIQKQDQFILLNKFYHWLRPEGKALFTYATKEYTGKDEFDGYKIFMGQELYYSHSTPESLYSTLKKIGFSIESTDYRDIGNEIFLWVTVSK